MHEDIKHVAILVDRIPFLKRPPREFSIAPLQPGTGTTDALLGAYYREALGNLNASWFVQANLQKWLA